MWSSRWWVPALACLLCACGFQPLYGSRGNGGAQPALSSALAGVYVAPIPDRIGQQLRNDLLDRLGTGRTATTQAYRLAVVLDPEQEALLIQSDETVTRYNFRLRARFEVTDIRSGDVIFNGRTQAIAAYNVVQSPFATVSAQNDAQRRAAQEVGEEIVSQLQLFFNRRTGS
jgi:LPS-assembly lipoprotein